MTALRSALGAFARAVAGRGPKPERAHRALVCIALVQLFFCETVRAQAMPRATLHGRITDERHEPIAGVQVAARSAAFPGSRRASSSPAGEFVFDLLAPGEYQVTLSRDGLPAMEVSVSLAAGAVSRVEIVLQTAPVQEAVTVIAHAARASSSDGGMTTAFHQSLIDRLPIDRSLRSIALLAPGVKDNGPTGTVGSANEQPAIAISGAPSYDSLFLIDGAVVNENLRGQPQDLFIEDAIQETIILSRRVSAEYGRFTGGVVSAMTHSGGNSLKGSLRVTAINDSWTANNPHDAALGVDHRVDEVEPVFEGTIGGPLSRDRVWFFGAARSTRLTDSRSTQSSSRPGDVGAAPLPYSHHLDEFRGEAKLTAALNDRHTVVASFTTVDQSETGFTFNSNILDLDGSLIDIRRPHSVLALHYDGVLTDTLFLEAQRSFRRFRIEQDGPVATNLIAGTRIFDSSRQLAGYHSPQAPLLEPQRFDNDSWVVKAARFVSTPSFGVHDLRFGYERFEESAAANQHVSGSDFRVFATTSILRGTDVYPSIRPGDTIRWSPIAHESAGTDLATDSLFVNDRVGLTRWSLNLGLRYDRNDDRDGAGNVVSQRDTVSPRLQVGRELGKHWPVLLTAGYGRYVAKIHDNLAGAGTDAGQRAELRWLYGGPCINCDVLAPTAVLLPTDLALGRLFDWFESVGGVASSPVAASIPGVSTRLADGGLESPSVVEYTLGASTNLGQRAFMALDMIYRDFDDFYSSRIDRSTGVSEPDLYGRTFDIAVIGSSNRLDRRYAALQTRFDYRSSDTFRAGATYTFSRLTGNFGGENRAVSAIAEAVDEYPEFKEERWNYPSGTITGGSPAIQAASDQKHRARIWIGVAPSLSLGRLDVSLLQSFDSGLSYQAAGVIDPRRYVVNPGYRTPPPAVGYLFTRPGAYRTENVTCTDLALTWTVPVGDSFELFVKPELINVWNENAVVAVDTTVFLLERFDPWNETPMRGEHYELGQDFGRPINGTGYQQPRTFRIGVGLRF